MKVEFQENQDLKGLMEKKDPQDQLEKLAHQEREESEDQKALKA